MCYYIEPESLYFWYIQRLIQCILKFPLQLHHQVSVCSKSESDSVNMQIGPPTPPTPPFEEWLYRSRFERPPLLPLPASHPSQFFQPIEESPPHNHQRGTRSDPIKAAAAAASKAGAEFELTETPQSTTPTLQRLLSCEAKCGPTPLVPYPTFSPLLNFSKSASSSSSISFAAAKAKLLVAVRENSMEGVAHPPPPKTMSKSPSISHFISRKMAEEEVPK